MADLETYLKAIANGETAELPEPTSALGVYLKAIIDGNTDVPEPTSVLGAYLYEIAKNGLGGAGGGGGGVKMTSGTVTPATETSLLEIEHGLGRVPNFAIVFINSGGVSKGYIATVWCFDKISKGGIRNANNLAYLGGGNGTDITKVYASEDYVYGIESATDTHFTAYSSSNMPFTTAKYMWIVG